MKPQPYVPLCLVLLLTSGWSAHATLVTEPTRVFAVGVDLADRQDPPLGFLAAISDSAIVSLTRVEVGLRLVGIDPGNGFAGEMYVALNRNLADSSILLHQVGVAPGNALGASYDGWDVTFADGAAAGDIHLASLETGILGGVWEPDGRIDPTGSVRDLLLDVFVGKPGNGDWRLVVGDLEYGGRMRLESWSLTLTGEDGAAPSPLPEAETSFLLTVVGFATLAGASASSRNASRKPRVR